MPITKNPLEDRANSLATNLLRIIVELNQDAKSHGFDITPYLQRLADLELFDPAALERAKDIPPKQVH